MSVAHSILLYGAGDCGSNSNRSDGQGAQSNLKEENQGSKRMVELD